MNVCACACVRAVLSVCSEGAPVPVPRDTGSYLGAGPRGEGGIASDGAAAVDRAGRGAPVARLGDAATAVRDGVLIAAGAAVVAALPGEELAVAVTAGPGRGTTRVVVAVLIQTDDVCCVGVAEDVATLAAVVATEEVAEGALAAGLIAQGGMRIRLPVVPRGIRLDGGEQLGVQFVVGKVLATVAGGAAGEARAKHAEAGQADEAAADAAQGEVVGIGTVLVLGGSRLVRRLEEVVGTQDGGDDERAVLARSVHASAAWRRGRAMTGAEGRGVLLLLRDLCGGEMVGLRAGVGEVRALDDGVGGRKVLRLQSGVVHRRHDEVGCHGCGRNY